MTVMRYSNRADWLEARKNSIGGSDLPALYGFGNRSALVVQLEKLGQLPEFQPSRRYQVGLILEPLVADAARSTLADLTIPEPEPNIIEMVLARDVPHAHASPDRWAFVPSALGLEEKPKAVVSLKTWVSSGKEDWADKPPTYTLLQLQHELLCTAHLGVEVGYITVLGGLAEWDMTFGPFEPNRALHERLKNEIPVWWQRHIVEQRPVQAGASDGEVLKTLYPNSKPTSWMVMTGETWRQKFLRMIEAKKAASEAEKAAEALENEFKQAMGETEIAVVGEIALKWKTSDRNGYTVAPTTTRTFRITKIPKEIEHEVKSLTSQESESPALQRDGDDLGLDTERSDEPSAPDETSGGS